MLKPDLRDLQKRFDYANNKQHWVPKQGRLPTNNTNNKECNKQGRRHKRVYSTKQDSKLGDRS